MNADLVIHYFLLLEHFLFYLFFLFFFQAEDGIRDSPVTGVQTCALPIFESILFPESKPFSVDQEARDVRRGKRAREFPHCVHCGSDAIRGHGTYKHYRRYLCVSCKKTFTDITKTCIAHIQKRDQFRQYIVCMIHGMSLRKAAKQTGVCLKTAFDWRHKILHALKMNPHQQLRGVTEADETFFRYSEKGSRKLSRPPRKRGGGKGPALTMNLFAC